MTGNGRLTGKVALITGAANGIGQAMARLFAAEGAAVRLADLDLAAAEAVARAIGQVDGGRARVYRCDVTRKEDLAALLDQLTRSDGRIDVLANNAGVGLRADFRHMTDEQWEQIRSVNIDAVVRVARDAFPLLKASGNASLINLGSIMGSRGMRQLAAYSVTKGAVSALTRALAAEYAPHGIRVNALAPGYVETALIDRFLRNPMVRKGLEDRTAMRRLGTPDEIAKAALFLASDDASYVTGAELVVDGGMSATL